MRLELGADGVVGGPRVGLGVAGLAAERDQVQEQPAALGVGEELVPEPGPGRGALDQPRDVGEHQLALAVVDRPQDRLQGRERVVGDLRRRPRQPRRSATTCPRSGARRGPRRRAASAAARSNRTRRRARARRSAGAWRVEEVKRLLPCPPAPPWATTARWPGCDQVVAPAVEALDLGAGRDQGRPRRTPRAPWRCLPWPWPPLPARWWGEKRSSARSRLDPSQTRTTSPPRPPSPPSGPPRGTCASRRKETTPLPPAPAST